MRKLGAGDGGQWLRDRTNLNPGFETEHTIHEDVGEIVGQAAPGIAASIGAFPATMAAGGGALAAAGASIAAGALVDTFTFEDDDNMFNFIDEVTRPSQGTPHPSLKKLPF